MGLYRQILKTNVTMTNLLEMIQYLTRMIFLNSSDNRKHKVLRNVEYSSKINGIQVMNKSNRFSSFEVISEFTSSIFEAFCS